MMAPPEFRPRGAIPNPCVLKPFYLPAIIAAMSFSTVLMGLISNLSTSSTLTTLGERKPCSVGIETGEANNYVH